MQHQGAGAAACAAAVHCCLQAYVQGRSDANMQHMAHMAHMAHMLKTGLHGPLIRALLLPPLPPHPCCRGRPPGDPKGVLLTHAAVVATVSSLIAFLQDVASASVGPGDSFLSYLPLAHIFDRRVPGAETLLVLCVGVCCCLHASWKGAACAPLPDARASRAALRTACAALRSGVARPRWPQHVSNQQGFPAQRFSRATTCHHHDVPPHAQGC